MPPPHEGSAQAPPRQAWLVLVATFFLVLAAAVVSTGLVVYTAWRHDLEDGLFSLLFAVLSARAVLSWRLWHHSLQSSASRCRGDRETRQPSDKTVR